MLLIGSEEEQQHLSSGVHSTLTVNTSRCLPVGTQYTNCKYFKLPACGINRIRKRTPALVFSYL
ncbi:hypothetical protein AB205_0082460 [Aquarana catesbeiana]|uniref:Uncharacterized protein n=1 Tax=Aquarana catesbeiana TaxID=8400 RepID=A0A2G9Q9B7_AQUCT|nr:hypothetical protein AB205_0082460 [Aquarana catesbeiana]PIO12189.1 hypothetical protein AB205_0082460 [Aquarana catesbeiana]